ncbi:MAG TPA: NAD(P)H-binding protein [Trebonia sp.]|jgi:uncharacterized protein YbjT (DUF2867 family)|nr:NAD(P)H-binding protein [Trebonia sp.]
MTQTVLVLGAAGKSGRRLVPRLAARGVSVRGASRRPGDDQVLFDWDRPETHRAALAGADAVYLITADGVEDTTRQVGPFLQTAVRSGVRRVVVVSSLLVEFPGTPPDSGRHRLEQQVRGSGLEWTILRPSFINQNFSEGFLLPGILAAGLVASTARDGKVAAVDADDIAAVAAAALTEPGHAGATYVLTGPEALTLDEAAATIAKAAGQPVRHQRITPDELTAILNQAGLPADYAASIVSSQVAIAEGHSAVVTGTVRDVGAKQPVRFAEYAAAAAVAGAWARQ